MKPSVNWLLAFVPATVAIERAGAAETIVFFPAALAIVPVAALIALEG